MNRMSKHDQYRRILSRYVPKEFVEMIVDLLADATVHFKIVKPRKTKLGDFRAKGKNDKPQITINGDLNPYSFLITTLHEFAHLKTFLEFGHRVAPHGEEWKTHYRYLLMPVVDHPATPEVLRKALITSLSRTKASSCTDIQLQRVLLSFSEGEEDLISLEELDKNSIFALDGRYFQKGILRRTRFLCTEVKTGKQFLINRLAQVKLEDEQ